MKLRIANLGVIKEATFDLSKKLTVFCGPNGTGKTYAAYVINSLLARELFYVPSITLDISSLLKIGEIKVEIPAEELYKIIKNELELFPETIPGIFPVAIDKRDELFGSLKVATNQTYEAFANNYVTSDIKVIHSLGSYKFNIHKPLNSQVVSIVYDRTAVEPLTLDSTLDFLLTLGISRALALYPNSSSTVLPVERNSIFTFSKELNLQKLAFFEQSKFVELKPRGLKELEKFIISRTTRYPHAIREALQVADDLSNISRTASPFYDFGVEVEQHLLQGKVGIDAGGEVNFAPNKAAGKSFSFQLSSSAVKTLSSLIVYLKYQAKPNDLLIIDEPELNLHPDNQILLARVFARMINKGMRLLISTHSDYIIRELNNLIMLSADEPALKKVAEGFGYHPDEKINREDIGVYLFHFKNPEDEHVTVESVEVAENGFEVKTIEDTINKLNAASEEIYYTMKYGYQHHGDN